MYCSKCGQKRFEGAQFCQKCGSRFAEPTPPVPVQDAQNETVAAFGRTGPQTMPQSGYAGADTAAMPQSGYTAQMPPSQYATPLRQDRQENSRHVSKGLFITITSLCAVAALLLGIWIGTSIAGLL